MASTILDLSNSFVAGFFFSCYLLQRLFLSCLVVLGKQWGRRDQTHVQYVWFSVVLMKWLITGWTKAIDQSKIFEVPLNLIYIQCLKQLLQKWLYMVFKWTRIMCQPNTSRELVTAFFLLSIISLLLKISLYCKLLYQVKIRPLCSYLRHLKQYVPFFQFKQNF